MRALTITAGDREWHEAFHDYVARVFPGVSFRRWAEYGGWQDGYRVFALLDANRIVASASLTRMDVVLQGRAVRGWQLGAVGTDPDYRGRGPFTGPHGSVSWWFLVTITHCKPGTLLP